ncbi:NAD(P)-binding protein [Marasmius fiardii PR-910]|nr:NAD(P)-binding protein [Marasmius fiardii PR-910]
MSGSDSLVVLITSCSSGIGRTIATEALSQALNCIDTLRTVGAHTMTLDMTASREDLVHFAKQAVAVYGQVDLLVNNAGYFQFGTAEETLCLSSPEQLRAQFETNLFGTINLTNACVSHFRARGTGTTLNISSMMAYLTWPG